MLDEQSTIGESCTIHSDAEVKESKLADEVVIAKGTNVVHCELGKKVMLGKNNNILYSKMGKYCYTGNNTSILNATLGKFNSISWNVSIGGNDHELNHVTTHSFLVYEKWGMGGHSNWESVSKPCQIGNDVWIASGTNIFRNVTIGDGAVIGGSAVVTKDVPPYAIVVGNPARILRYRCKEEMIEKLLALKWWDFPEEVIKANFIKFIVDKVYKGIEGIESFTIPERQIAAIAFKGEYMQIGEIKIYMEKWINDNGYKLIGIPFSTYYRSPENEIDSGQFITELCFPIEKVSLD